jgi:DNA repair exonuclease SbcCD ATPase subunit
MVEQQNPSPAPRPDEKSVPQPQGGQDTVACLIQVADSLQNGIEAIKSRLASIQMPASGRGGSQSPVDAPNDPANAVKDEAVAASAQRDEAAKDGVKAAPVAASAQPAQAANAGTPEQELAQKQAGLKDVQDKLAALQQSATTLQSDIDALHAKVTEVNQAYSGYEASFASLQRKIDDANKTIQQKRTVSEAMLKDDASKIDEKVDAFDKDLAARQADLTKSMTSAQNADALAKTADADAQQKQADYDILKAAVQDASASVADVGNLLDMSTRAEAQGDFVSTYFLAGEAKRIADGIQVAAPNDYINALRAAQDRRDQAAADAAQKKAAADALAATYAADKQKLEAAQSSRRADILDSIKQPAPPAAQG